ncbi:MAG: archaeosortase/exosortase family protein, partial [Verrucomicrobiota bacterium]
MSGSTPNDSTPSSLVLCNLLVIGAFWSIFYYQLSYEWSVSEQYSYGFFVPFVGLYLAWLHWQDRPLPAPAKTLSRRA